MKNEKIIRGQWWIGGPNQPPQAGTLDLNSDALLLSVWNPQNKSTGEVVIAGGIEHRRPELPAVLHGTDEHNKPIILFGCGVDGRGFSSGIASLDVRAIAALKGIKVESWQEPVARSVQFQLKYLHRWFGRNLLEPFLTAENKPSYSLQEPMDLVFPLEEGVQIRFTDQSGHSVDDEHKFIPDSHIWFHFQEKRSLNEILERWRPWVTRLMGLLVGQSMDVDEITVFADNPFNPVEAPFQPRGILFLKGGQSQGTAARRPPSQFDMLVPFDSVKQRLGELVTAWNRVSTTLEPVIALFGVVALQQSLYLEAQFLFLVQALEVYHATSRHFSSKELQPAEREKLLEEAKQALPAHVWKWAKGKLSMNSRSLSQKLLDILRAHERESKILFGDLERAASRIAYTRNHLTHHLENLDVDRLIPAEEIFRVSWSLEALLWIVLLREIGLGGNSVEEILRKVNGTTFVHIAG